MYAQSYSASGFWDKITSIPKDSGCEIIRQAITLYTLLTEADIPILAKASIVAALGYFIFPLDLIQDPIPLIGLSDDLVVLTGLVVELCVFITPKIEQRVSDYMPDICAGDLG